MNKKVRTEVIDGREYKVTIFPDVLPPKNRSHTTRFKLKPGNKNKS